MNGVLIEFGRYQIAFNKSLQIRWAGLSVLMNWVKFQYRQVLGLLSKKNNPFKGFHWHLQEERIFWLIFNFAFLN